MSPPPKKCNPGGDVPRAPQQMQSLMWKLWKLFSHEVRTFIGENLEELTTPTGGARSTTDPIHHTNWFGLDPHTNWQGQIYHTNWWGWSTTPTGEARITTLSGGAGVRVIASITSTQIPQMNDSTTYKIVLSAHESKFLLGCSTDGKSSSQLFLPFAPLIGGKGVPHALSHELH